MRRSYLRIRRNRTHNGRPFTRERVRDDRAAAPESDGDRERALAPETPRGDGDVANRRDRG